MNIVKGKRYYPSVVSFNKDEKYKRESKEKQKSQQPMRCITTMKKDLSSRSIT